jgi:chromate transporter
VVVSDHPHPSPQVSVGALFIGFLKIGLSGFGGVLPFARRMLVDQRHWLTEEEFVGVLSLSQFLPGPNIVNVSIMVGRRFQGSVGAIAATVGLMLMPLIIVLLLAAVYAQYAQIGAVRGASTGVSAAASGLVIAVALKIARPIRRTRWQIGIAAAAFVAIGFARLPLFWVLAVLAPLSLLIAWRRR